MTTRQWDSQGRDWKRRRLWPIIQETFDQHLAAYIRVDLPLLYLSASPASPLSSVDLSFVSPISSSFPQKCTFLSSVICFLSLNLTLRRPPFRRHQPLRTHIANLLHAPYKYDVKNTRTLLTYSTQVSWKWATWGLLQADTGLTIMIPLRLLFNAPFGIRYCFRVDGGTIYRVNRCTVAAKERDII